MFYPMKDESSREWNFHCIPPIPSDVSLSLFTLVGLFIEKIAFLHSLRSAKFDLNVTRPHYDITFISWNFLLIIMTLHLSESEH